VGAEKLPDLDKPFSIYGSAYYYWNVHGNYDNTQFPAAACPSCPNSEFGTVNNSFDVGYRVLKYEIGGTWNFGTSPVYLDFGYLGDRGDVKSNAPVGFTHNGPYLGIGLHF